MSGQWPFRFGVATIGSGSAIAWKETAQKAEATGFSTLSVSDHIASQLAPLTALMAAASVTSTLRLGSYVFANDFYHPAVLAREAATIDLLSNGRLEFGFGTGWLAEDYQQRGIVKDRPSLQVNRFEEAIQVMKGLFADQPYTIAGAYYTINGYQALPKPAQRPHPPLLIGGGGRRMLAIAAREADIIGIDSPALATGGRLMTAAAMDQQVAWLNQQPSGAKQERNGIVLAVRIADDRQAAAEQLNRDYDGWDHGMTIAEMLESPYLLFGSVASITEQLQQRRERYGISYITFYGEDHIDTCAPIIAQLAGK